MFDFELNLIKNNKIKESGKLLVSMLPEYFYSIAASSTGKYHPKYTCGEMGLYKHVKVAVKIANSLLELEMYNKIFSSDEQDLIILALTLHDGFKKGIKEEKYTRFDHPIIMKDFIINNKDNLPMENDLTIKLASLIETHMGQWVYDYKGNEVLKKPVDRCQKFVHMCDYLASRKFLNVEFDENNEIID